MKKYEFTGETKMLGGITLRRIRALISFGSVTAGDVGGWIESEKNLSHASNAWVYGNARVSGEAQVYGAADVLTIGPIGSRSATLTIHPDTTCGVRFTTGCFSGSRDEFVAAVAERHPSGKYRDQYDLAVKLADITIVTAEIK